MKKLALIPTLFVFALLSAGAGMTYYYFDASQITSGTLSASRLPAGATTSALKTTATITWTTSATEVWGTVNNYSHDHHADEVTGGQLAAGRMPSSPDFTTEVKIAGNLAALAKDINQTTIETVLVGSDINPATIDASTSIKEQGNRIALQTDVNQTSVEVVLVGSDIMPATIDASTSIRSQGNLVALATDVNKSSIEAVLTGTLISHDHLKYQGNDIAIAKDINKTSIETVLLASTNIIPPNHHMLAGDWLALGKRFKLIATFVTPATATETEQGLYHLTMTYNATPAYYQKAFMYALNVNGTTDGLTLADSDEFSIGDSSSDSAFSIGCWVEKGANATQYIMSKWDETTGAELREWIFYETSGGAIRFLMWDESANKQSLKSTDAAPAAGWHFYTATYSGVGGGSAYNGINMYVDGVAVAATGAGDGTYVAGENTATGVRISGITGTGGTLASQYVNDMGAQFIVAADLTSTEVYLMYERTRGYYGL